MIIAGDIGGTKSHLVAYDEQNGKLSVVADEFVANALPAIVHRMIQWLLLRKSQKGAGHRRQQ